METKTHALCGEKLILIDAFESNDFSVKVYITNDKRSVKKYCKETGLLFKEGFKRYDDGGLKYD